MASEPAAAVPLEESSVERSPALSSTGAPLDDSGEHDTFDLSAATVPSATTSANVTPQTPRRNSITEISDKQRRKTLIRRAKRTTSALAGAELTKSIVLSNAGIKNLPPKVCESPMLETLYMHGNFVSSLPPEFRRLNLLTSLRMGKNLFEEVPMIIFSSCPQLEILDLSHNMISVVPAEIGQLTKLEKLYLQKNDIQELPQTMAGLTTLKRLDVTRNPLVYPPPEVLEDGLDAVRAYMAAEGSPSSQPTDAKGERKKKNAMFKAAKIEAAVKKSFSTRQLFLTDSDVAAFPASALDNTELQEIFLRGNQINDLPAAFGTQFTELRILRMAANQFKNFPTPVLRCTKLIVLDLGVNNLTSLPEEIGALVNMEHLLLYRNNIKELPKGVGKMRRLTRLDLGANPLTFPPEMIMKRGVTSVICFLNGEPLPFSHATKKSAGHQNINGALTMDVPVSPLRGGGAGSQASTPVAGAGSVQDTEVNESQPLLSSKAAARTPTKGARASVASPAPTPQKQKRYDLQENNGCCTIL